MYDVNWKTHSYFLSSQETGFQLSMLDKFDVELLIGQVSYKQKAEIYNISNGYDNARKMWKGKSTATPDGNAGDSKVKRRDCSEVKFL